MKGQIGLSENELISTLEIKVSYFVTVTSGVLTCESKIVLTKVEHLLLWNQK